MENTATWRANKANFPAAFCEQIHLCCMGRKDFLLLLKKKQANNNNQKKPLQQHYKSSVSVWPFEGVTRAKNKGKIPTRQAVCLRCHCYHLCWGWLFLIITIFSLGTETWGEQIKPQTFLWSSSSGLCEALEVTKMTSSLFSGVPASPVGFMAGLGPSAGSGWVAAGSPLLSCALHMPDVGSGCSLSARL